MRRAWLEFAIVLAITVLALSIRLYRLPEIPFGLHSDEAANGVDTLNVLSGQRPIYFAANTGREPLFIYLQAFSVGLLGNTPYALRLPAALVGAATIPAVYWLVREAFQDTDLPAVALAAWTALFLATCYWHVHFSRLGLRAITLPLVAALAFACFWRSRRAILDGRAFPWVWALLGGILLGGCLYTYTAGRAAPILFLLLAGAGVWLIGRPGASYGDLSTRRKRLLLLAGIMALSALVAFLPLGLYALAHPDMFDARQAQLSVFNPDVNGGHLFQTLGASFARTLGIFALLPDPTWRYDPAMRPALTWFIAAWVLAGALVALRRSRSLPYLFALAWLAIFLLPAALTLEDLPHTLRSVGVLPAAYLLPVIGLMAAGRWLSRRLGWRWLALWLPLPFLLWSATVDLRAYFGSWQTFHEQLRESFNMRYLETARFITQHPQADTVWVLPAYPILSGPDTKYTLDFLSLRNTTFKWGAALSNAPEAAGQLQALTAGERIANLVTWPDTGMVYNGVYAPVDGKGLLAFLLGKYGTVVGQSGGQGLRYTSYRLVQDRPWQIAGQLQPADVSFGGQVRLAGLAYGRAPVEGAADRGASGAPTVPSDGLLWVVLRWQAATRLANDLKVSLLVTDAAGHVAGQADDNLVADDYLFKTDWPAGKPASTYHLLDLLPGVPPGTYTLRAAVYRAESGERLAAESTAEPGRAASAALGEVEIGPPLAPSSPEPAHRMAPGREPAPGLLLLGYDLAGDAFSPGDTLPLTLYWQPQGQLPDDVRAWVELRRPDGEVVAQHETRLGTAWSPLAAWPAGSTQRNWQDLAVPATLPTGSYQLVVGAAAGNAPAGEVTLQTVQVRGRPHNFVAPNVRQPASAAFDDGISLFGYDLPRVQVQPGASLPITLYWQARASVAGSYAVFVHLLGPDDHVWAQQDNPPASGAAPTQTWLKGEYIADGYALPLPLAIPPGTYRLELGLYDPQTGRRLALRGAQGLPAGDHITLPETIQVK